MDQRKVVIMVRATDSIAAIAEYLSTKGLPTTAERFIDAAYKFIYKLGDPLKRHPICRDPERARLILKCVSYKKKYTIVFSESSTTIIIQDFILSSWIYW